MFILFWWFKLMLYQSSIKFANKYFTLRIIRRLLPSIQVSNNNNTFFIFNIFFILEIVTNTVYIRKTVEFILFYTADAEWQHCIYKHTYENMNYTLTIYVFVGDECFSLDNVFIWMIPSWDSSIYAIFARSSFFILTV